MENTIGQTIQITIGDNILTATMYNNASASDFLSLLPLSLTLSDYEGMEKVSILPRKLSTKDAPAGYKPSVGELTYYAPWGNPAIFYEGFAYANGLVRLGKINTDLQPLKASGNVQVKIERI